MEGISQEAIALAGHLRLARLIVLFDDNGISIDGPLALSDSVDQLKRFEACGWNAWRVDGHDPEAVAAAIAETGATSPKDMGRVMKAVMAKLAGQNVDGKTVNELVRQKLGAA